MDSDRVILVAGVTAVAAVVGTFILWGPSTAIRPKRKGSSTCTMYTVQYVHILLQIPRFCVDFY